MVIGVVFIGNHVWFELLDLLIASIRCLEIAIVKTVFWFIVELTYEAV